MTSPDSDKVFAGSIPKLYDTLLVPLIFEPYAADMVSRLVERPLSKVLEVAAGTGVVTRAMASALPDDVSIVATDLNQTMLDHAATTLRGRNLEWHQADALKLPFADESFDAVVCQFGAMFFPDKVKAFAEARRVLKPHGLYLFSVWDRLEDNEFAYEATNAHQSLFPNDPPQFLARTPHGYHQREVIERHVAAAGFTASPMLETVTARSLAASARQPALAYCQGTPLRNEIEARNTVSLEAATDAAAEAIARRFGRGAVDSKIQAHVITVVR
jgi:ubiquinone/menaquinone biosynthesis C-methylase UbiE